MSTDHPSSVNIQANALPMASVPAWFGEVALIAHTMTRLGLLSDISERVRFTRKRFGRFEVIDFVVMLIGYALSGEPTRHPRMTSACSHLRWSLWPYSDATITNHQRHDVARSATHRRPQPSLLYFFLRQNSLLHLLILSVL